MRLFVLLGVAGPMVWVKIAFPGRTRGADMGGVQGGISFANPRIGVPGADEKACDRQVALGLLWGEKGYEMCRTFATA